MGSVWPSKLYNILTTLKSTLGGISIADGYQTDVVTAYSFYDDYLLNDLGGYPKLMIVVGSERVEFDSTINGGGCSDTISCPIAVLGAVYAADGEDLDVLQVSALKLQQDIHAAIKSDVTIGGYVDELREITREVTLHKENRIATVLCGLQVVYEEDPED